MISSEYEAQHLVKVCSKGRAVNYNFGYLEPQWVKIWQPAGAIGSLRVTRILINQNRNGLKDGDLQEPYNQV